MKLKAQTRVQALIRAYDIHTTPCMVTAKGDPDAGTIFIKICSMDGLAVVYTETRNIKGDPAWRKGTGPDPVLEKNADDYIDRQRNIDPDAWVLEVEDPSHTLHMIEPVITV